MRAPQSYGPVHARGQARAAPTLSELTSPALPALRSAPATVLEALRTPAARREAECLRLLRRGDPDAFEALVRESEPRLLATARRILRSDEDAREAVQQAWLCALRALPRFEGGSSLRTWLHRIAINSALMMLRTRRRHPEDELE